MELISCDDAHAWTDFVRRSPHRSIFCEVPYLESLGVDFDLWFLTENGVPALAALLLLDGDGRPQRAPFAFTPYQGVLFAPEHAHAPIHTRVHHGLDCVDRMLEELAARYASISFGLHPTFEDVRSFSWFNYDAPERGQFDVKVRYTGWIDLTAPATFEEYVSGIRKVRAYEWRRGHRDGLYVENLEDLDLLVELYRATFARQDIDVPAATEMRLRRIVERALAVGYGELLLCRTGDDEPASATLFLYDDRCGYYLVGANDPEHRKTGSGTVLFLENIRRCFDRGLHRVDVCGMNSPARGDFKASFNAAPVPYMVATWHSPEDGQDSDRETE